MKTDALHTVIDCYLQKLEDWSIYYSFHQKKVHTFVEPSTQNWQHKHKKTQENSSSEEGEPILLDPDPTKYWQYICTVPLGP